MKIIAHIENNFKEKFGIPRQSGLVDNTLSRIVFEKKYRAREAFRGLEEFSHIWILWKFSESEREDWSPTVRPPLLGGNKRMGVFATRSPFRPNPVGLSCVRLEKIEYTKDMGPVLTVCGADLMDKTPIYDIKPYLAYADAHPDAKGGFTESLGERRVNVVCECEGFDSLPSDMRNEIIKVLEQDPTPSYKKDGVSYGMKYGEYEIKFRIQNDTLFITEIMFG